MSARGTRRAALLGAALAGVILLVGAGVLRPRSGVAPSAPSVVPRVVALSPAITETLFAIGAGACVVAVDDYSDHPAAVRALPRVGSALRPDHERILAARPTLILGERIRAAREADLARVAPTVLLPWLTLADLAAGTRELGRLTGRAAEADVLATRLSTELSRTPAADAPRVLLVLRYAAGAPTELVYVRRGSAHGAALEAAGARNAVGAERDGVPRLSLERVLEVDPDAVIVLTGAAGAHGDRALIASEWQGLRSLRAVREGRIGAVSGAEAYSNGPRILDLVPRLGAELRALGLTPAPG